MIKMYIGRHVSTRYSCPILIKLEFSRQIFEKYSNIKFHENPSSGSRVVACGRADMTKLIVAFRNYVNVPKKIHARNVIVIKQQKIKLGE
jgi:hypothetical protein